MIPSPIVKVLSSIRKQGVRALMMGGQACILYGAAEFSRDLDLAVLADEKNLDRMRRALGELKAYPVYVPAFSKEALLQGHACHFRAQIPGTEDLRIDIMSVLHGCDSFEELWKRRAKLRLPKIGTINVLALEDLVRAKKTQRDKDWPMVRRLVEADFHRRRRKPTPARIAFWFRELRTPAALIELCEEFPDQVPLHSQRLAVQAARRGDLTQVERVLRDEEEYYRNVDRVYWAPLKQQLFDWRQAQRKRPSREG